MNKQKNKSGIGILSALGQDGKIYLGVTQKQEHSDDWILLPVSSIDEDGKTWHSTAVGCRKETLIPIVDVSRLSDDEQHKVIDRFLQKLILMRQLKQEHLLSI